MVRAQVGGVSLTQHTTLLGTWQCILFQVIPDCVSCYVTFGTVSKKKNLRHFKIVCIAQRQEVLLNSTEFLMRERKCNVCMWLYVVESL